MTLNYNIPLQTQLAYMMHELGGSEKATADAFASGQYVTPQDYATAFENKYERAGGSKIGMRQQYALEVFNAMKSPELAAGLPQNARTSYEYFIKQGMSPAQAAGIVGNLMVESFNRVDPQAFNPAGGNMGAYGVAQWRGPRQQGLLDFAKTRPQPLAASGVRSALNMQPQQNTNRKVQPMQQRPQNQQNGLLGFFKNQNPSTGLTKAQQFAAALDPLIMPSMRAGEGIRAQGQQRVKQKTNNATAAYLRANGMGDIADMMEAGNIDGSAVTSALMQTRMATPKGVTVGNRVVDPKTGKVIYDGGADPKDAAALRKEFIGIDGVKDFGKQSRAYSRVLASAKNPSGAGDLALIFNFMKVLDPGSTVREGEFATAQNSGGVGSKIVSLYNQVISGERLSQIQREDFVRRSTMLYEGAKSDFDGLREQYSSIATRLGYDVSTTLPDFSFSGSVPLSAPSASAPNANAPLPVPTVPLGATANGQPLSQADWAAIWNSKTIEQQRKWMDTGSF